MRVNDDELRKLIRESLDGGEQSYINFVYALRSQRISCDDRRARRVWEELGGPVRQRFQLYAPGTEPLKKTDPRNRTNRGPNHWRP